MKEKFSKKPTNDENWVKIKKSHVFGSEEVRCLSKPGDWVLYDSGSISVHKFPDMPGKIKFMGIVTQKMVPLLVPIYMLDFSAEQKSELLLRHPKKIAKKDFEAIHFKVTEREEEPEPEETLLDVLSDPLPSGKIVAKR